MFSLFKRLQFAYSLSKYTTGTSSVQGTWHSWLQFAYSLSKSTTGTNSVQGTWHSWLQFAYSLSSLFIEIYYRNQ